MRVCRQLLAVLAAAVASAAVSIGPTTWACTRRCSIDVSKAEKPECYTRLPDDDIAEDSDRDIISAWCVCNAPALNTSLHECITSKCPEGSWDYFLGDCRINYIGKPDPDIINGGDALGPASVVATGATVLVLALFGSF